LIRASLDVSDAKDAFKLFETINDRGLQLSPTDIIKNFLLGNAARLNDAALDVARESWTSIVEHLDQTNSDTFFRYFLTTHTYTALTTSQVVKEFKIFFMTGVIEASGLPEIKYYAQSEEGSEIDDEDQREISEDSEPSSDSERPSLALRKIELRVSFEDFLTNLVISAKTFGELVHAQTGIPKIDRHLRNLRMIKSTQIYGYLMHLRVGGCDEKQFLEILNLTEAFVLRRHICKERPDSPHHASIVASL